MSDAILIAPIRDFHSMVEVENLQRDVWRFPDLEIVPAAHIAAAVAAGGSLIGAWDRDELVGFAYGFGGIEHGTVAHHSHMLAVKDSHRNRDLGRRLKFAQRDFVVSLGVGLMSWTFDPLQSANAHFNFRKLGAFSHEYFVNFYGEEAGSPLHQTGTDRLWMQWNLLESGDRPTIPTEPEQALTLVAGPLREPAFQEGVIDSCEALRIPVPRSINSLLKEDREAAFTWRTVTRRAFQEAFEKGYAAVDFQRTPDHVDQGGSYVLRKLNI